MDGFFFWGGAGSSLMRHPGLRPLWLLPQPGSPRCSKSRPSPCGDPPRSDIEHRPCPWSHGWFAWAAAAGCPRWCLEPRQQRLLVLSVLCGSHWRYDQYPQDEGHSRPHFSVRNPGWYKPNRIQHQCCQSSLKWLLCRSEVGCPFFQSFPFQGCLDNPALIWHFQTGRQDHDAAVLGLLNLIWWKHFCNYSKNVYFWYLALSLNGKENISRAVKYFSSYFHGNPIKKIK